MRRGKAADVRGAARFLAEALTTVRGLCGNPSDHEQFSVVGLVDRWISPGRSGFHRLLADPRHRFTP
jgi:hypothetical protein